MQLAAALLIGAIMGSVWWSAVLVLVLLLAVERVAAAVGLELVTRGRITRPGPSAFTAGG